MSITKVALAGATGNLGPAILKQLLSAGFQVSVLTRQTSSHSFPSPSVTVIPVDYQSIDSLTKALTGHDAVVSTLSIEGLGAQSNLIEAAVKAKVQRFIPSEFGGDLSIEKTSQNPIFKYKVDAQAALRKASSESDLSYTFIYSGPFLDWGIMVGFILNVKEKSINLYDGGERLFSTSTLEDVGKAVVAVLKNPEQTKNRAVRIQSTATSLKQLAEKGKKATGGAEGWTEKEVSIKQLEEEAWAALKGGKGPDVWAVPFITASIWGEGTGSHFSQLDNELLGIKELDDAGVQEIVNQYA
ncbi:hypothetical protein FQN57_006518 [Myotisia sp. PD_48]|nr:hypothetical protein FQN57_006518 [Myotisia sp. PD_48]